MLLRSFESFEKTENGYLIHGDAADVKLVFMTDDIIRIRVHFDKGTPMEEESYTLVTTAWEDRMDTLLKDERTRITALDVPCAEDDKALTFETAHLTLKLFKKPFHFELFDKSGKLIYQDLRERATSPRGSGNTTTSTALAKRPAIWTKRDAACGCPPRMPSATTPRPATRCISTSPSISG